MQAVTTIGLDIAKSVFQVHGVDAAGQVLIRRQLKSCAVLAFFQKLPVCLVGIEACASSKARRWSPRSSCRDRCVQHRDLTFAATSANVPRSNVAGPRPEPLILGRIRTSAVDIGERPNELSQTAFPRDAQM